MRRLRLSLLAAVLVATPAMAQDWGTYFNMGTFGAGGGSDANGWLNLECAGQDSGFTTAGQPYLSIRAKDGVTLNKKSVDDLSLWVGDDQSFVLPLSLETGSNTTLVYNYSAETVPAVVELVAALRQGSRFAVTRGPELENIASITLDGSNDALDAIAACIAGEA